MVVGSTEMGKLMSIEELEKIGINHDRDWTQVYMNIKWRFILVPIDDYNNKHIKEYTEWMHLSIGGRYHSYGRSYWFEFEEDALLFRLKYG